MCQDPLGWRWRVVGTRDADLHLSHLGRHNLRGLGQAGDLHREWLDQWLVQLRCRFGSGKLLGHLLRQSILRSQLFHLVIMIRNPLKNPLLEVLLDLL